MNKIAVIALLACSLGGCAAVPLATGLALGVAGVAAAGLAVTAIHDCKSDGGCKKIKLPE